MAEQIPYGVATSLINRLGSAALREFGRINGVMDELERLKNTVESINAVLLDADDKQDQSHAVQNWLRRLKDVLIPADDLLDEFAIQDIIQKRDEPHRNKVTKVLHSLSPNRIAFRHKMAHEIEKIQKKFNDVVRDMSGLKLNPNVVIVEETNTVSRETGSYVLESDIIGREEDKKKIISLLRKQHEIQNVSFVAIVGIGGLGKTALAQLVYSDVEVQNLFEKSMWVCISDNFDVKSIVTNMLNSLLANENIDDKLSLDNLQHKLRDNLTGKRYLLVLDDIWNESSEKWEKLRTYLMCGAQGSKVVVTTRSRIVAHTMDVSVPYVLSGLIPEESWSLLKKIAFRDDTNGVNQTIESIGKKIAEKCKGVPLAIRSLGGILKNKREENEWGHVLRGDFWKLCEDKESILPILKLSYHNLSPQQRQCFAFCSLFPKDLEFEKEELIQMWMAHGYLDCSVEGKCMEDLGNQFVNIFLMKSFFQEAKLNEDGDIIGFKMHDLMHDLAIQVAGDDCCYLDNTEKSCPGRPMHVSVEFGAFCLLESLDTSRLRTLIMFYSNLNESSDSNFNESFDREKQSIISTFKYLRVLKFYDYNYIRLCVSIEKLMHLRLLDIHRECVLKSLHMSMGNLVCLQTIRVRLDEKVVLSTKVVSKSINLRYLEINGGILRDKTQSVGFGKLSLQQHETVIFSNWLSSLTNIIEISLRFCEGLRYLPPMECLPSLKSLDLFFLDQLEYIYYEETTLHESFFPSLESLRIMGCGRLRGWRKMGDGFNDNKSSHNLFLPQFPCLSWLNVTDCPMFTHMATFPNIKSLILDNYSVEILGVKNVPHDWLQNLTYLEYLDLFGLSSQHCQVIETWFKADIKYFPSLKIINFTHCLDLKALPDWICNFSSLQHIKISCCRDLALMPEGMPHLNNLHTLEINDSPLLVEECLTEASATCSRIAHIPNIIINK